MLAAKVDTIRQRLAAACRRVGRSPDELTLVSVAKTFPAELVREVVHAGVPDVGENYVQELLQKREALREEQVRWHFIGHLQSNKAKYIVPWITLIHAVDNERLAAEIDRRAGQAGKVQEVLIEVNTTGEDTKYGVRPEGAKDLVRSLAALVHIRIAGLMTIGPFLPDPEGSRPMFRTLRELSDELSLMGQQNVTMRHLSMGMTGDFEVAIEEGASIIRIGTAIFGSRNKRS
jgi:pyridoxal phosphate enzyme (YggS family)